MSQFAPMTKIGKLLKGSKGKELMLTGASLVALSSYLQPSGAVTSAPMNVMLFLGALTFIFGLVLRIFEKDKNHPRIQASAKKGKKAKSKAKCVSLKCKH